MTKYLNELEHVEQELEELRNHLEQSFGVLEGLAKVQTQFEDLAQTYQQFKEHLDEVKATRSSTEQLQATFNHRFAELEKVIESRLVEVKSEVFNIQNELGNADVSLSAELTKQLGNLKAEVEERLTVFQQEWVSYKKASQTTLNELEVRLKTELQAYMNQLSEAQLNDQYLEKQQRLEHQLRAAASCLDDVQQQVDKVERHLRNVERQMHVMSRWIVVAVLTTVLALGLAFVLALL